VEQLGKYQDLFEQLSEAEKSADPEMSDQGMLLVSLLKQGI
jgi:hypothetical protein